MDEATGWEGRCCPKLVVKVSLRIWGVERRFWTRALSGLKSLAKRKSGTSPGDVVCEVPGSVPAK